MDSTPYAELSARFEKSLQATRLLLADENGRLPRLQLLLSEHDRDVASRELLQTRQQLETVESQNSELQKESLRVRKEMMDLYYHFQSKLKVLHDMQARLTSNDALTAEVNQLKTENAVLTREISAMTPEIRRLRSQSTTYQSVLSEKLSLERQLNSLEVELLAEKRKSAMRRSSVFGKPDTALNALDVAVDNEDPATASLRKVPKASSQNASSTVPKKQAKAKDGNRSPARIQKSKASIESSENLARRSIFGVDAAIGTPGPNKPSKLPTKISAAPGDKSIFSITPFLNRQSNDFEGQFTSSASEDGGMSFAEQRASRSEKSGHSRRDNGASDTNTELSSVQPQQEKLKPDVTVQKKAAVKPVPKRAQKQKRPKQTVSENEEHEEPLKKRHLTQPLGGKTVVDENPRIMRNLPKQNPFLRDRGGVFADDDGILFESDHRNRQLGSRLQIPQFSPLKRNMRPI